MFKILTLNNISVAGLDRLPRDKYEIASEIQHPDAVLVRSFKMHDWPVPDTLQAIGRERVGQPIREVIEFRPGNLPPLEDEGDPVAEGLRVPGDLNSEAIPVGGRARCHAFFQRQQGGQIG